ncbi:uncharacterized protein LOC131232676 [Magnolia sinica]|uniref:uncharacterized protein LOC131232676 n=1 Tax=Magnolia sinica TaxID=86752 RepID=UPI002658118F|nr:uncharacterized protein LOC131232676 [Magnolia sinica]
MISLTSPSPSLSSLLLQPHFQSRISTLKTLELKRRKSERNNRIRRCRAELSQDAPFALAIGACVLNSLIFPIPRGPDEPVDGGSAIDSTDTRFAVMGIVSFIPYFNWLSWVFAWLDTSSRRYLVYSIVYLAPYLRTNLSLSPEESWLPIASIVFCIVHIQLEASIRNGDLKTTELFGELLKSLSPVTRKKDSHIQSQQGISNKRNGEEQLPSPQEEHENKLREWGVPRKPLDNSQQHLNDDEDKMDNQKD